jgi:hypothetical protein
MDEAQTNAENMRNEKSNSYGDVSVPDIELDSEPSPHDNSPKEAKRRFARLTERNVDSILDNLVDSVNDHGVAIAHDSAVPDKDED